MVAAGTSTLLLFTSIFFLDFSAVTAQHWPSGCGSGGPSPCVDGSGNKVPCLPKFAPTYLMQRSTIFMPCNYSGPYNPTVMMVTMMMMMIICFIYKLLPLGG